MGRKQAAPSARALVIAFAAVAVSFVLATLVSERSDVKIRRDAAAITGNAAPSIVHLEAFRSEARRLVILADDEVDRAQERQFQRDRQHESRQARAGRVARSLAPTSAGVDLPTESLARLEREWTLYRALPTFRGERELAAQVVDVRDRFVADLQRVLSLARAGDANTALETLEGEVKPAADALDEAAVKVVERNAQEADHLAARID